MSNFKKHVGRIKNTDRRCVVVYMQIPGNDDNALVVDTDALPDRFHDALMDIIDSTEGQQVNHLHTLLSRRMLPDLGLDMMNALHTYGQLRAVPIDNIVMFPAPNAACPLRTIVDYVNSDDTEEVKKERLDNRVLENQRNDATQAQVDIAMNIIKQAEDLETEALKKREKAYQMAPTLRQQVTDSPAVTEASETAPENVNETSSTDQVGADTQKANEPAESPTGLSQEKLSQLPPEVRQALAAAQASPPAYNIMESADASLPPMAPQYDLVENDPILPPTTPEYDLVEGQEGNEVDTSDEAIQEFLDRVALREDMADREAWLASQPKNPVGRPRKDGQPAGSVGKEPPAPPAPKKRGRPPKAKS